MGTGNPTTVERLFRTVIDGGIHASKLAGMSTPRTVLYALRGSQYETPGGLEAVAEVGAWISKTLKRQNASRVGRALEAHRAREKLEKERENDGGAAELIAAKL
ncbi:hypothetical protein BN946_scf184910.g21 [Trametes cinnabarina]|uniref:Uncharacterized protein n=1 Tax=Pycnoporus cinnabarinus TaxID=5643 RepID=A0A060SAH9_PYCCI|nr:hypothetical protein BN946_scf184910.g21 [Trametes cinnabarina]